MTAESAAPYTQHAWALYLQASEEARSQGDRRTGTDHILLALLGDPAVEALLHVDVQTARQVRASLDEAAFAAMGLASIDAPSLAMRAVPSKPRIRDVARQDRLRMTPAAKRVLEEASKLNRRRIRLTAAQVLAQLLELQPPDPAAVLLGALGVNTAEFRRELRASTTHD